MRRSDNDAHPFTHSRPISAYKVIGLKIFNVSRSRIHLILIVCSKQLIAQRRSANIEKK